MILKSSGLASLRKKLKHKKIVFVSGCFDILHQGHVEFLERAAKYGDVLVVGVLSDRYIRTKKHRKGIFSQSERARIIAALKPVDHAVLTPYTTNPYPSLEVISMLRPDIFLRCEKSHMYKPLKKTTEITRHTMQISRHEKSEFKFASHSKSKSDQDTVTSYHEK